MSSLACAPLNGRGRLSNCRKRKIPLVQECDGGLNELHRRAEEQREASRPRLAHTQGRRRGRAQGRRYVQLAALRTQMPPAV
jgi:hypothetical protein